MSTHIRSCIWFWKKEKKLSAIQAFRQTEQAVFSSNNVLFFFLVNYRINSSCKIKLWVKMFATPSKVVCQLKIKKTKGLLPHRVPAVLDEFKYIYRIGKSNGDVYRVLCAGSFGVIKNKLNMFHLIITWNGLSLFLSHKPVNRPSVNPAFHQPFFSQADDLSTRAPVNPSISQTPLPADP